jgi:uncharacterized lipoprotein YmbA
MLKTTPRQTCFEFFWVNFDHSNLFRTSIFGFRISSISIRRTVQAFAALFFVVALTSCSSPPSRFYTLSAAGATAKNSSDLSVAVGPVSIPAVIDRPEIVVSLGPNQVRLEEFNRWALPLQNNIARVIAENLMAQLGTPRVTVFPEITSADADYRAIIDVQRFDSMPGEAATLEALWIVRRMKDGKAERGRTTVRQSVTEKDYAALAAAHSQAIVRLSQEIADAVRALDRADKS